MTVYADNARQFLDALYGSEQGYAHFPVGVGGYINESGKYVFPQGKWENGHTFAWPEQADAAVGHILDRRRDGDVYAAVHLMRGKQRREGGAVSHRVLHADHDKGAFDLTRARDLKGVFAVGSGTPGNGHIYALLDGDVPVVWWRMLQDAWVRFWDGDSKLADNDVLRPPGSYNWKAVARGETDTPAVVEFLVAPTGERIAPADLAEILGVRLPELRDTGTAGTSAPITPARRRDDRHVLEPVDVASTPALIALAGQIVDDDLKVRKVDGAVDRSDDLRRAVNLCAGQGLSIPQTTWLVRNLRDDLAAKHDEIKSRDEIAHLWSTRDQFIARQRAEEREFFGQYPRASRRPRAGTGTTSSEDDVEQEGDQAGDDTADSTAGYHSDATQSDLFARDRLKGRFLYCQPLGGWREYRNGLWTSVTDDRVRMLAKRYAESLLKRAIRKGKSLGEIKLYIGRLSAAKIDAVVRLARGEVEADPAEFDADPDLLCVGNGVVDLRTGKLSAHSPRYRSTKGTPVEYRPGHTHVDWDAALAALEPEVAQYMQVRYGQGITGHPPEDDVMPVSRADGSNGKSTITDAITAAAGDYAVLVPERALMGNPDNHPTELMVFRGARLAIVDETPEARHLNVARVKAILGASTMTARLCGRDSTSWTRSHSIFISTNHRPRVAETDHGTWRRLMEIPFPFTFRRPGEALGEFDRPGDPNLKGRIMAGQDGQLEAVLAWLVDGARRWYDNDRTMPPIPAAVRAATNRWRQESDVLMAFVGDELVADTERHVAATELFAAFVAYLRGVGGALWNDQTFSARMASHEWTKLHRVEKRRVSSNATVSRPNDGLTGLVQLPRQYTAWVGLRFVDERPQARLAG